MNGFTFYSPTRVVFGRDAEDRVGAEIKALGGGNALLIYGGGSAVRSGLVARVTASLEAQGIACHPVGGAQPNPLLSLCQETVDAYRDKGIDFIVAVGGGSVIDTAKAVAIGLCAPDTPVWDFYLGKAKPMRALPKCAVLTIAAAGSETSDSSVITNGETGEKRGLNTDLNRPQLAFMNPELTCTLPPRQTACGVADILMHTLDRYFAPSADNALTDGIAEALLRTAIEYGRVAMECPEDYKARSELMWCGSLSHNNLTGLGQTKDFSVHALGHELSGKFNIPHGESLTVMWPAWARHVWRTEPMRFARLGRNVWGLEAAGVEAGALACIGAFEDYFHALGMPVSFGQAEMGVQSDEILRDLAVRCTFYGKRTVGVFQPMGEEDIYAVYKAANR